MSGYIGQKIVERFSNREDIGEIIGIDIAQPKRLSAKLTFIRHDVRSDMYPLLKDRDIDWAIHAAFILPPIHGKERHVPGLHNRIFYLGFSKFMPHSLLNWFSRLLSRRLSDFIPVSVMALFNGLKSK